MCAAKALGLDLPFPLVNGTNTIEFLYSNNQAFSYAYGSAGILPETGGAMVRKFTRSWH